VTELTYNDLVYYFRFNYMAISDDIQRYMPSAADRDEPRGTALAYKEAVLLVNPQEPQFKGEVNYLPKHACHATLLLQ
jgi:hypothetical protein